MVFGVARQIPATVAPTKSSQVSKAIANVPRRVRYSTQRCNSAAVKTAHPSFEASAKTTEAAPASTIPAPVAPIPKEQVNISDLNDRQQVVQQYFPSALGIDDFMSRVEIALCKYGFTGDNSIAMTNLCRDEITTLLKDKIEAAFGGSFNTNGLGGVLTCGVTGIGAGLSHSPICSDSGRERYVFFSFPHIAIGADGELGSIMRPGRPGKSCACGALIKCLGELKKEGISENCKVPGVHGPEDPEYTILKQRLARRIRYEQVNINDITLSEITKIAERTITDDLEYLIEKAVNIEKADFAVVTGVQIHNWAPELGNGVPSLEFVAPAKVYTVVNGNYNYINLTDIPSLTPRQIQLLAAQSMGLNPEDLGSTGVAGIGAVTATSTIKPIPNSYLAKRIGNLRDSKGTVSISMPNVSNGTQKLGKN